MVGEDGRQAADHGARGVIVSNHGARYLDTTLATIEALPEVGEAVAGQAEVYLDGGIRRGTDVVKALALGAAAVLIGRAPLYGVAAAGEAGASRAITIFREEIERTMALLGVRSVAELDRRYLQRADAGGGVEAEPAPQALRRLS
jgi:isopentenyl diphosphate isomerase/L-lactate dehydrogenase-like FMN-dependent dehydrogenase